MALKNIQYLLKKRLEVIIGPREKLLLSARQSWPGILQTISIRSSAKPLKAVRSTLYVGCGSLAESAALNIKKTSILNLLNRNLTTDQHFSDLKFIVRPKS